MKGDELTKPIVVIISQYIHVSIIMLYTLNLSNIICQLYLNKTRGIKVNNNNKTNLLH